MAAPTSDPTPSPTPSPTEEPTEQPTPSPTDNPSPNPTKGPTFSPTPGPTPVPTRSPTPSPSPSPTKEPTDIPTADPTTATPTTGTPTGEPTLEPTSDPTAMPVECIPIIDTNTICGRQLTEFDCENAEGVTDCIYDSSLNGCHIECAYDASVCQACGCVVVDEDCVSQSVIEEAANAAMRIDEYVEDSLSIENQMIDGVDDVYVYIGITMFALMFIGLVAFMLYKYHRRQKKKYQEMEEDNIMALQMNEIEVEEFGTR